LTNRFQIGNVADMETVIRTHPLTAFRASQEPPLSMADLARMLDVSKPTLSRWESFQREIDDEEVLARVASRTGIPARTLNPKLFEKSERLSKMFAEGADQ
jgi:transcriptional regulator with XRE-family HTH domain